MTNLSDLIKAANKEGWSSRQIASRAAKLGHPVGHATVNNYVAGKVPKNPTEDVLQALAVVFNLPLVKVRRAANLSAAVTDTALPPEASRLTPRQWNAVREIIMSMVNPGDEIEGGGKVAGRIGSLESELRGVAKRGKIEEAGEFD